MASESSVELPPADGERREKEAEDDTEQEDASQMSVCPQSSDYCLQECQVSSRNSIPLLYDNIYSKWNALLSITYTRVIVP